MQVKVSVAVVVALFGCSAVSAGEGCRDEFNGSLEHYTHIVDALRLDKPGQARVYAPDGLRFTPAEAFWLKGQLRELEASCRRHASSDAGQRLERVRWLIESKAHR